MTRKRILTGDRPTGRLHLGHWVGSVSNRVKLQEEYEPQRADILKQREYVREMLIDWLACGIDPAKSTIFLQSAIPEVYELNLLFETLVSVNRLSGLPSIKEMARNAHIEEESIPFGLLGYPVLMSADILLAKAHLVPVGKDN